MACEAAFTFHLHGILVVPFFLPYRAVTNLRIATLLKIYHWRAIMC